MDDLINALENFIEKKIAAELEHINDGGVSHYNYTHLAISRDELRAALDALGFEIRSKNND
jgi:hypothetical protein